MHILDQILENLELERDLGTRTIEMDRALLVPPKVDRAEKPSPEPPAPAPSHSTSPSSAPAPSPSSSSSSSPSPSPSPSSSSSPSPSPSPSSSSSPSPSPDSSPGCDIAFFTGRPLSPAGAEAMEKIFVAIRKIKPGAVLCMNEERNAKICVLLGSDALQKRNPAARPVRGAWTSVGGVPAVMTFSPDYIFTHFQEDSPRMKDAKLVMWNDIKSAVARLV